MFYEVIPEGKVEALTYDFDEKLVPGQIVLVPLGRRTVPGAVLKKVARPEFATKSVTKILYTEPLPRQLLVAAKFVHDYYLAPLGSAISLVLPKGVEKKRRSFNNEVSRLADTACPSDTLRAALAKSSCSAGHTVSTSLLTSKTEQAPSKPQILLNQAQKKALRGLQEARSATKLLFGVTGSGKTNIYLKCAENALKQQKSAIILVPEIALTGQLVRVFREIFGDKITLIHSQQTEAERHRIFDSLLFTDEPRVVIGPRSALFAPVKNLGLIIVDEEHEGTYYQENAPRYSAVRVASAMAQALQIPLILGSATPTAEDFYLAHKQGSLIELTAKAKTTAVKPQVTVIDLKDRGQFAKNRYFSGALLKAMADNLEQGRQTLIFHNRRGSSTLSVCEKCGEEILCPHCFLPLTLHADTYNLVCHTCGLQQPVPTACPKCGAPGIIHKGFGTKLLESEIRKLFPKARVRRFDADNKKDEGMAAVYGAVRAGEVDILVGTQTLAKGLDLPKLTTVGVVQADAGLSLPDFAAEERVFQLLTQVMGRVGRGHQEVAEVFVQTFQPEHPVLKYALAEDYKGFFAYLAAKRRAASLPPFAFILQLEITMKTEATVVRKVREVVRRLGADPRLIVSPPQPAFHERTERGYTWQIIVRSRSRKALLEACAGLDKNFKITLDPPSLL